MKKTTLLFPVLLCMLALDGCSHPTQSPPPSSVPPAAQTSPTTVSAPPSTATPSASPPPAAPSPASPAGAAAPMHQATVYQVDMSQGTRADHYLVPHTVTIAHPLDPATEAVEALIDEKNSPIAPGAKLQKIDIAHGLATVDFSHSPVNQYGGEEAQEQAIAALQQTLGQFPNIHQMEITVRGKEPASLGQAAPGPMDVIRTVARNQKTKGV